MSLLTLMTSLLFVLFSCLSTVENQSINKTIIGEWETEKCTIHSFHANFDFQLTDKEKIPRTRINPSFSIEFKLDTSFILSNKNGSTEIGSFKLKDSSLTLTLNNEKLIWLSFHIDSLTDNNIFLSSDRILFYTKTADTVDFVTGDKVSIILKKKKKTGYNTVFNHFRASWLGLVYSPFASSHRWRLVSPLIPKKA